MSSFALPESIWLFISVLSLQFFVIVLAAWVLHRLLRHHPRSQHSVWLLAIVAIFGAVPIQQFIPSFKLNVEQSLKSMVRSDSASQQAQYTLDDIDGSENFGDMSPAFMDGITKTPNSSSPIGSAITSGGSAASSSAGIAISKPSSPSRFQLNFGFVQYSLIAVYFAISFLLLVRILVGVLQLQMLATQATSLANELRDRLVPDHWSFPKRTRILVSNLVSAPMAYGVLRPTVLLPNSFLGWQTDLQKSALLHELCHIKRRDAIWDLLARVTASVYWFHPAVHIAARSLRQTREIATDSALLESGVSATDYATQLLELASETSASNQLAIPMAKGQVDKRIRNILSSKSVYRKPSALLCSVLAIVFFCIAGLSIRVSKARSLPVLLSSLSLQQEDSNRDAGDSMDKAALPEIDGATFLERIRQIKPGKNQSQQDTPSTPTSASGTIVDKQGNPVVGATVVFRSAIGTSATGEKTNRVLAKTVADSNGQFHFHDVPVTQKSRVLEIVAVSNDGRIGWRMFYKKGKLADNDVVLEKSTRVRCRIVDSNNVPQSGVQVTLTRLTGGRGMNQTASQYRNSLMSPEAMTDSEGYFEFPQLPGNVVVKFCLNHPNYAPNQRVDVSTFDNKTRQLKEEFDVETLYENGANITIQNGTLFRGKIVDQLGDPIDNVEICFPGKIFKTNHNGSFQLRLTEDVIYNDRISLVTRHKDFGVTKIRASANGLRDGSEIVTLPRKGKIKGRVVAEDDETPVVGARVRAWNQATSSSEFGYVNENGDFLIDGLVPGEWKILLAGPIPSFDVSSGIESAHTVTVTSEKSSDVELSVARIKPIDVKVLDSKGHAVIGAKVNASFRSGTAYRSLFREDWQVTDMDGSAMLLPTHQPNESTVLIAKWEKDGVIYMAEKYFDGDIETNQLTLSPAKILRGKVTVNGKPVSKARIQIANKHQPVPHREGNMQMQVIVSRHLKSLDTDENGNYSLPVPSVGPAGGQPGFSVCLLSSNSIPNRNVGNLTETASFDGDQFSKDIKLIRGSGKVSGLVVDKNGEPVPNVIVHAYQFVLRDGSKLRSSRLFLPCQCTTDEKGSFAIEGLPVGATVTLTTKLSRLSQRGKRDTNAYRTTKKLTVETKTNVTIALPNK